MNEPKSQNESKSQDVRPGWRRGWKPFVRDMELLFDIPRQILSLAWKVIKDPKKSDKDERQ